MAGPSGNVNAFDEIPQCRIDMLLYILGTLSYSIALFEVS